VCAVVRVERHSLASYLLGVGESALYPGPEAPSYDDGILALNRAVAANPTSFRARLTLSQLLLVGGRADESARAAEAALAIEPYAANASVALANAEAALGNLDQARKAATAALDILHDDPPALELRARVDDLEGAFPEQARTDRAALHALAGSTDRDTRRSARRLLHESEE
jgi:tetratricopeptide (TPR) repeat protein